MSVARRLANAVQNEFVLSNLHAPRDAEEYVVGCLKIPTLEVSPVFLEPHPGARRGPEVEVSRELPGVQGADGVSTSNS